jgi:hypothetical protein
LYLACGHNGQRIVSEDGIHWNAPVLGKEGEVYRAAAAGGGTMVCMGRYGGQNIIASSRDGVTWKLGGNDAKYKDYLYGVAYGHDTFLALGGDPGAVGAGAPFVMTSTNGEDWSAIEKTGNAYILRRVAWGNDRWVGVGDRGRRASSPDGKTWQDAPKVKAIDTLGDIAFGNGVFVGVGLHGLRMTSKDGISWENRQTGIEGEHLNSILWADHHFVAIGLGGTWTSADGVTWDRKDNQNAPLTAAYARGSFIGVHWKGRILHSTDAVAWKEVFKCDEHLEAVAAA